MRSGEQAGVFDDERGSLVAVEFGAVPFQVRRVFVVNGRPGGSDRGDHVVPCSQAIVLLAGEVRVRTSRADSGEQLEARLDRRGQSLYLDSGDYVRYRLADEHSSILVLAEHPYVQSEEADR